jgi:hypothetical protein
VDERTEAFAMSSSIERVALLVLLPEVPARLKAFKGLGLLRIC